VLLATAVAVLHGAAVLLMLTGALLALRWPRLVAVHVPVAVAILAVNLAGADCPLTAWELDLRADAGLPAYTGGFLGHYFFAPLGLDVHSTAVRIGVYTVALGLNAVGYGLLLARAHRRRVRQRRGYPVSSRSRPSWCSIPTASSLRHHSAMRPPSIR
jgi:hypothetical protein